MDDLSEGKKCETYIPLARSAAICLQHCRFEVDVLGLDQDDYHSRFLEQAWRVGEKEGITWHASPSEENEKPKVHSYISRAVWNLMRDFQRKRQADRVRRLAEPVSDLDRLPTSVDLERQAENREILARIRNRLPPQYWEILEQYAEAGCKPAAAWNEDSGVKYDAWKTRLKRARAQARTLWEKIERC